MSTQELAQKILEIIQKSRENDLRQQNANSSAILLRQALGEIESLCFREALKEQQNQ